MKINVIQNLNDFCTPLFNIAIVIDVFRATSTIVAALANGAKEIIACETQEAALIYRERKNHVLAGEKNIMKLPSFDFGNSPQNFIREKIANKTVVLTTTNGTQAIHRCKGLQKIYIASLLNAATVSRKLFNEDNNFTIICSGSSGRYAIEDAICAGMIIDYLLPLTHIEDDDFINSLLTIYRENKKNKNAMIRQGKSYKQLITSGLHEDIHFCLQENIYEIAPVSFGNGIIK